MTEVAGLVLISLAISTALARALLAVLPRRLPAARHRACDRHPWGYRAVVQLQGLPPSTPCTCPDAPRSDARHRA